MPALPVIATLNRFVFSPEARRRPTLQSPCHRSSRWDKTSEQQWSNVVAINTKELETERLEKIDSNARLIFACPSQCCPCSVRRRRRHQCEDSQGRHR